MKKTISITALCAVLLAGGCGTDDQTENNSILQDDWQTIKEVDGREIIAELKQTGKESLARDQAAQEQFDSPDYIGGFFGEPSTELEEDMAVQAIEGPIAIEAVEEVYGGSEEFKKEGILFLENQIYNAANAAQSGVWIGVKNPDDRVQKLIDLLQSRVDAGEILAKPIYIFRSPYTQQELYEIQDKVVKVLQDMKQERDSFSLSVNTITGVVQVGHDFMDVEQQKELEKQFPDQSFQFEQVDHVVEEPAMSAITYPEKDVTDRPVEDGGFIMEVSDNSIFVSGGTEGAAYYSFDEADHLTVGQRVKVEASGGIMESYPGQGAAKYVEILPDYKPADAVLTESMVVAKVIEEKKQAYFDFNIIKEVSYDGERSVWMLKVSDGSEVIVEDR